MHSFFLVKEKQYRKLFLAGVINGIGDRFSQVSTLALLLQLTGSGFAVGVTMALRLLPFLIFGPLGGRLADRYSRKILLIVTDLARVGFALSFLLVHTRHDIWIIYVSSFILASGEAIYAPTRKATLPLLISREQLVKVNSMEQVLVGIVLIGGALAGGVVSYLFGPSPTFWLNGFSFLAAAWIISTIKILKPIHHHEDQDNKKESLSLSLKHVILLSIPLQIILLCELLVPLVNGIDNVLISVYAVEIFHLGNVGVGTFYGALGIGLIASFPVANRIKKHYLLIGLSCLFFEGCMMLFLSHAYSTLLAVMIFCSSAFFSGIGNACLDTVLMQEIPEKHQGMMFGIIATLSNTLLGLSMLLTGCSLDVISPRLLGFLGGTSLLCISIFLFMTYSIRRSKEVSN